MPVPLLDDQDNTENDRFPDGLDADHTMDDDDSKEELLGDVPIETSSRLLKGNLIDHDANDCK